MPATIPSVTLARDGLYAVRHKVFPA